MRRPSTLTWTWLMFHRNCAKTWARCRRRKPVDCRTSSKQATSRAHSTTTPRFLTVKLVWRSWPTPLAKWDGTGWASPTIHPRSKSPTVRVRKTCWNKGEPFSNTTLNGLNKALISVCSTVWNPTFLKAANWTTPTMCSQSWTMWSPASTP